MSVSEIVNLMWRLVLANNDNNEAIDTGKANAAIYAAFPDATRAEILAAWDMFKEQANRYERLVLACEKVALETGLPLDPAGSLLGFLRRAAGTGNKRAFETLRRYEPILVTLPADEL